MSSKKICVFQMHHTDIVPPAEEFNPVIKIKNSGLFDHVVLAVPDMEENRHLKEYAEAWGVDIFFGSVTNVTLRILDAAQFYKCDVIARPSIYWFYLDVNLVARMLNALESSGADFVDLPPNFDLRFGADVFSIRFLRKMLDIFEMSPEAKARFQFHPWGYPELHPEEFQVFEFTDVPVYDQDRFDEIARLTSTVWPERAGTSEKLGPYQFAAKYVRSTDTVLDIACGEGTGTAFLAEYAKKAVGADISERYIRRCKEKYAENRKVSFVCSDVFDLKFEEGMFDVIVSSHTMEHVEDDVEFLSRLWTWLRKGGLLVLEVPLLVQYPFKDIGRPLNPQHIREYSVSELEKLLASKFLIEERFGVTRGFYTDISRARNAAMMIARKV